MTTETSPAPALPITGVEKAMAAASHGSWLIGIPFVPAVISLVWGMAIRPSAFLRGHALQALIFQVSAFIGVVCVMFLVFAIFASPHLPEIWSGLQAGKPLGPAIEQGMPSTMTQTSTLILVASLLAYVGLTYLLAILAAIRVFDGRRDAYPLIGRFFR